MLATSQTTFAQCFTAGQPEGIQTMTADSKPAAHYDFVIVGARCAGAATAIDLARAGASVLVVDRQEYGSDRMSTHALMRGAMLQLREWNLLDRLLVEGTPKVTRTTFHYSGDEDVSLDIKPEAGIDFLLAPRRTVLDRALVDAARSAGAEVRHGIAVADLLHGIAGRVLGVVARDADGERIEIRADMVIGADGRQSMVAKLVDAQIYRHGRNASASVYGYYDGMPNSGYHWYFADGAAAGAIPTNAGQHCVFASVPMARFAETFRTDIEAGFMATVTANSPELAEKLDIANRPDKLRGFGGAPGFMRQSFGNGWALVGDAGYFKDPATAHGITDALRDARLLSRALTGESVGSLSRYQAQRDALSTELFEVTDEIAGLGDMNAMQALHYRLSKAIKAETAFMAEAGNPPKLAA